MLGWQNVPLGRHHVHHSLKPSVKVEDVQRPALLVSELARTSVASTIDSNGPAPVTHFAQHPAAFRSSSQTVELVLSTD